MSINQKKSEIALYGAFDRLNYGDLLFPILVEKFIEEYLPDYKDRFQVNYYGVVKSNLTKFGGKPTQSIRLFIQNAQPNDILIICGGETLFPTWKLILQYLESNNSVIRGFKRIVTNLKLNKKLDITGFPFVFSKNEFKNRPKIIYNAVGGSNSAFIDDKMVSAIYDRLNEADLITVRDIYTLKNLQPFVSNVKLEPDIAILLSHYFPKLSLSSFVVNSSYRFVLNNPYFVFQMGINYYRSLSDKSILIKQIKEIINQTKLKIVLLPIGTAKGHEDHIVLNTIKKEVEEAIVISNPTIYETMYLIANAQLVVATSLHANITAFSYLVPAVPLTDIDPKLPAFEETWNPTSSSVYFYNVSEMSRAANEKLKVDKEVIQKNLYTAQEKCFMMKKIMAEIISC